MARGSLNKVMLIGRLGADPDLRYTPQGQSVCTFNLATDESYKDQNGSTVDRTEWHRVVVWRKLAEIAGQYCRKGSLVYIEGKLTTRSWEKDGQKHYSTEIIASELNMLGNKQDGSTGSSFTPASSGVSTKTNQQSEPSSTPPPAFDIPSADFDDNDLPF